MLYGDYSIIFHITLLFHCLIDYDLESILKLIFLKPTVMVAKTHFRLAFLHFDDV